MTGGTIECGDRDRARGKEAQEKAGTDEEIPYFVGVVTRESIVEPEGKSPLVPPSTSSGQALYERGRPSQEVKRL